MSRTDKLILFMLFLYGSISFCPVVSARENPLLREDDAKQEVKIEIPEVIANRPKVEYKSASLRDPFQTYILNEKNNLTPAQTGTVLSKPTVNFNELKVQGIIWGTKVPQAIINNNVYTLGDKIEDAEIISIDNKGVTFNCASGIINLAAPGQESALSETTNQPNVPNNVN